ncbi:MAG: hypothetical protein AB8G86_19345 [Saprospiraceae bacterium]
MHFLLALLYLFIASGISYFLYFYSAVFKVVGDSSMEEFNEEETNPNDRLNEKKTNAVNHFGTFVLNYTRQKNAMLSVYSVPPW